MELTTLLLIGAVVLLICSMLLSAALFYMLLRQRKEIDKLDEMCRAGRARRMDDIVKEVGELKKIELLPEDAFRAFFARVQEEVLKDRVTKE